MQMLGQSDKTESDSFEIEYNAKRVRIGRRLKKMIDQLPLVELGGITEESEETRLQAHMMELHQYYFVQMNSHIFNDLTEGLITQTQNGIMKVV